MTKRLVKLDLSEVCDTLRECKMEEYSGIFPAIIVKDSISPDDACFQVNKNLYNLICDDFTDYQLVRIMNKVKIKSVQTIDV